MRPGDEFPAPFYSILNLAEARRLWCRSVFPSARSEVAMTDWYLTETGDTFAVAICASAGWAGRATNDRAL